MEQQTIDHIKEGTAIEHGWISYEAICDAHRNGAISNFSFDDFMDDVIKLYSQHREQLAVRTTIQELFKKGYLPSPISQKGQKERMEELDKIEQEIISKLKNL